MTYTGGLLDAPSTRVCAPCLFPQPASTRRGIACLRTRHGGVNDPAGLPTWLSSGSTPPAPVAGCAPWERRGQTNARPGERA